MKKTSKPAPKKTAAKKPVAKKSSAKPKRKAAGQGDFAQLVERLAVIADRLAETAYRLNEAAGRFDLTDALENLDAIADKLADIGNKVTGISERETIPQDEIREGAGEEEVVVIVDQHKEE
jgi:hypothetical protein